jgi:protease-4
MTKEQKLTLLFIIILPIILGFTLLFYKGKDSSISPKIFKKIGLVKISDVIISSENYTKQLKEFREDEAIAGVILRIESPGGAVVPSQEIYKEILKYRGVKPIIASLGNIAASGGYYIASAATKIFACPGSITASIGVIFRFPQYYKLMDKLGINIQTIKSGEVKDMGSPQREMTQKEKIIFQEILDDIHNQFIKDVSKARKINEDSIKALADGRIMTGTQALKVGLIDTLGTFEEACDYLRKILGLSKSTPIVEKKQKPSLLESILSGDVNEKIKFAKNIFYVSGPFFIYDK